MMPMWSLPVAPAAWCADAVPIEHNSRQHQANAEHDGKQVSESTTNPHGLAGQYKVKFHHHS